MGFKRNNLKLSPEKPRSIKRSSINFLTQENFTSLDLEKTFSNFSDNTSSDRKESLEKNKISENVILKVTQILENVGSPDFNIFELDEYIGRKSLFYITNAIFNSADLEGLYDRDKFRNFINAITDGYKREVDYHNDLHAGDVLQTSWVFISKGRLREKLSLQDIDIFAVLLAAICHDFKHPGYNNIYLVNTKAPLAIRYNGKYNNIYKLN